METIIARQGQESRSMKEFKFIERFGLSRYLGLFEPLIIFGVYHKEDEDLIRAHKGKVIVWWMGVDSLQVRNVEVFKHHNVINVAMMQNIIDHLKNVDIDCHLVRPFKLRGDQKPVLKGNKIYAYLNKRKPLYYGLELIKSLETSFDLLITDYSISQVDWYGGRNKDFFSQCFVGLALSDYAGGGSSVIECGLFGLRCITNLMNMPNTIRWQTKQDIEDAIKTESAKIGTIDEELSKKVNDYIYVDKVFDLDKMLI